MLLGSPYTKLSHKQRELTPAPFARMLMERSHARAALWVRHDSAYTGLLDCWDVTRDARTFTGPGPIICHPPCGPWGKLAWKCKYQSRIDGILAIQFVHQYGGVVEQPVGSSLFRLYGCSCGTIEQVNQGDYGHRIPKPTLLFWHPGGTVHSA